MELVAHRTAQPSIPRQRPFAHLGLQVLCHSVAINTLGVVLVNILDQVQVVMPISMWHHLHLHHRHVSLTFHIHRCHLAHIITLQVLHALLVEETFNGMTDHADTNHEGLNEHKYKAPKLSALYTCVQVINFQQFCKHSRNTQQWMWRPELELPL